VPSMQLIVPHMRADQRRSHSTLLKSDQWFKESGPTENGVRGAINFRNVSGTKIYALGQPSLDAIDAVVGRIRSDHPFAKKIVWITLREEPIVYVNGECPIISWYAVETLILNATRSTILPSARQVFVAKHEGLHSYLICAATYDALTARTILESVHSAWRHWKVSQNARSRSRRLPFAQID
jgi:hypothetical protein